MFKEDETQYCKNCYELQQQLDQLKEEKEIVNDFLSDTASCLAYDGNSPANLDEVYICIEDICKANYNLDKNAKLYRQTLQEINNLLKKSMGKVNANTHFSLIEEAIKKCEEVNADI